MAQEPHEETEQPRDPPHFAPVANYYGTPYVTLREGSPVIGIEDCEGRAEKAVSQAFYDAWLREFESDSLGDENPAG